MLKGNHDDNKRCHKVIDRRVIQATQSLASLLMIALLSLIRVEAQRVVSLMPSATETMVQIGADANIVGRTSFCPKPSDGVKTTIVGDAMTVNLEMILSLRPDVVVASNFTNRQTCQQIERLGIKLIVLETAKDFEDICNQTTLLGEQTSHQKEAEALVKRERHKVDSLASRLKTRRLKTYVQVGANPVFGATPDYYIEDVLRRLNLKNILEEGKGGSSREAVVALRPDLIVVSTMGGLGKEEAMKWHQTTEATVMLMDENVLSCPSPTTFRKTMEAIGNAAVQASQYRRQSGQDANTGASMR